MNIKIYGKLGQIYGKELKLKVGNLDYLVHAIDCVKSGFRDTLKRLKEAGQNYFIIRRGLDVCIVPCVCGMGKSFKTILIGILIVVLAVVLAIFTAGAGLAALTGMVQASSAAVAAGTATAGSMVSVFSAAAGLSTLAQIGIAVSMISLNIGISLIVSGLTMQKPPDPEGKKATVGGSVGSLAGIGRSYLFSDSHNQAVQGKVVPIGYGRVTTGGKIINVATKSYPTTSSFSIEINNFPNHYINI